MLPDIKHTCSKQSDTMYYHHDTSVQVNLNVTACHTAISVTMLPRHTIYMLRAVIVALMVCACLEVLVSHIVLC